VSNGPDRLLVFQARLQALKDHFKNASLPLDGGVCGLIEEPAQSAVAFGRTATARLLGADLLAWANSPQEARAFSAGKTSAVGPISAMIGWADSTPRPGTSANRSTAPA
jgi:hypothetical protein